MRLDLSWEVRRDSISKKEGPITYGVIFVRSVKVLVMLVDIARFLGVMKVHSSRSFRDLIHG